MTEKTFCALQKVASELRKEAGTLQALKDSGILKLLKKTTLRTNPLLAAPRESFARWLNSVRTGREPLRYGIEALNNSEGFRTIFPQKLTTMRNALIGSVKTLGEVPDIARGLTAKDSAALRDTAVYMRDLTNAGYTTALTDALKKMMRDAKLYKSVGK